MPRAEKKTETVDLSNLFSSIIEDVGEEAEQHHSHVPNIVDFCYKKEYLNLLDQVGSRIELYPTQMIVLKAFYAGSLGNEDLKLTDEEIAHLREIGSGEWVEDIIRKHKDGNYLRELILVFGRRSGKNVLCSIMALYELLKLLEIPGGNPFPHYGIAEGNPIYILTVANSREQSTILFNEMKMRIIGSDYFTKRSSVAESEQIFFLTHADIKRNKTVRHDMRTKGSVVILCGHSNSDTLLGKRVFALLFDEVATFGSHSGTTGGDAIYRKLLPSTSDFVLRLPDGSIRLDSKVITISSPKAKEGILWRLFSETTDKKKGKSRITFRLPTWKVNLNQSQEMLIEEFSALSPEQFNMEYGAQFAGLAGEKFIPDEYIDKSIDWSLGNRPSGERGVAYYAHLDPATRSHNYAMVLLHVENRRVEDKDGFDRDREEAAKFYVVDHVMVWRPVSTYTGEGDSVEKAIRVKDIDDYIIKLARTFNIAMVSYDDWQSHSSIQTLRKNGVPARVTPFRKAYKMSIYENLYNLLVAGRIVLPGHGEYTSLLVGELKCLKRIWTPSGFKIKPDEEAMYKTDDTVDALAGAIGSAMRNLYSGWAQGATVSLPQTRPGNIWQIGRGSYNPEQLKKFGRMLGQ